MPEPKVKPFPEYVQVWDANMMEYISDLERMPPSAEWREVAEYKLIRVIRVRYRQEWE